MISDSYEFHEWLVEVLLSSLNEDYDGDFVQLLLQLIDVV